MKVLVHCIIKIEPTKREDALKAAVPLINMALDEPGCLAYTWAADMDEADTVHVYEEWENQESLEAHFTAPSYYKMSDHLAQSGLLGAEARKFLISDEAPIYNEEGVATADFS